ncbi:Phage-integrase repeat unit [Marinobacter sp. DSM 26671]|uniref:gamma-mobile-trio integrase GmtZ n=1 Tax=Marinobacter sp. DSM 26671 TaxID=1761793 RepID=UPI0008EBE763|nr:VPA1269 family protein [Marinobacter sp. DSM 26671]SFE62128.1 Phage-integrase repeat unit [Marinobacter sp. DSM 26671]
MTTKYATYAEASEAAQRLGFTSQPEYNKGYRQDPSLSSAPYKAYAEDWVDWYDFLGTERPGEKYATYAEASEAAQRLGFISQSEYAKGYRQDPRLRSAPDKAYAEDWVDWYDFLGTERPGEKFYATYAEASEVAQGLGLTSLSEYLKSYRQDPRLPSAPDRAYAEDWVDWYDFLGTERPGEKYATYAEASEAAQGLGLTSLPEYKKGYRQDPSLSSVPDKTYAENWVDWYDFLGTERPGEKFYATYAEASEAAQKLGLTSRHEYKKGYRQDPSLPSDPDKIYAENWVSWPMFLGNESAFDPELLTIYPRIWEAIQRYVEAGTNQAAKYSHLRAFLRVYVAGQKLIDDPGAMLSRDIPFNESAYEAFVHATGDTVKKPRHNICADFLEWVLKNYCADVDDEGELIFLPGFRNPLRTVLKGLLDQFPSYRRSESNKPPLPLDAILRAKGHLIPPDATSFRDLYSLHPFLEDCWFEVDPELIDENDPNCIYRTVTKDRKKQDGERYFEEAYELWSPVKIVANYVLLSMPLRGQQICWLDSGEGDEFIPVLREGKVCWVKNISHLATPKRNQGFLRRGEEGELSSYITTNKTGKKLGGYNIPFMPDGLAYWIIQLRDWQSKYNPIDELTPWTKIKLRHPTNKDILKRRGKQAFLFRDPASLACEEKVSPMFTTTTFARTLPALLFHSQSPGEDLAERIQKKNSVDYKSQFTPHALRVSLITAYIVDGRMSIAVISKLVGHASLVMTIYYTKVGHSMMRKELAAAEKRALEQSLDRYQDLIIQKKIDEARSELIATDRTTLDQCLNSNWPAAAFQLMSIGICPVGGAKCDQGGEPLVERKQEAFYAPVPSGYLGTRNCPRCRFFITGPAFLGGLSAIVNEIILEINVIRKEYHELEEQRQAFDDERYDAESAGKMFGNERKLKKVTAAYEEKARKLDMLACDLQHLYRLITQSTELLNKTETDKQQLIVSENYVEMDMHLDEQQSDFRLLAEVCANAEIYESASASRAQPLLTQMLDKLADTNGIAPAMFRLTDDQQLRAANQVVQLLMKQTGNDWHLADSLVNGQISLEDLAEPLKFGDIRKEIESVMNGSLKFPLGIEICDE